MAVHPAECNHSLEALLRWPQLRKVQNAAWDQTETIWGARRTSACRFDLEMIAVFVS
jgi:hypothetical protein